MESETTVTEASDVDKPDGECAPCASPCYPAFRWEQCYELGDAVLWAIVDDESAAKRSVTSHLLVVNHDWADSLGRPFPECELPQRIIALLNADEGHFDRAVSVMRAYKSPRNGKPYSEEGLHDLERQCLDAATAGDSSLLEMAGLAIRRLLSERREPVQQPKCAKCRGEGVVLGPSDSGYRDCPACDGKGF